MKWGKFTIFWSVKNESNSVLEPVKYIREVPKAAGVQLKYPSSDYLPLQFLICSSTKDNFGN